MGGGTVSADLHALAAKQLASAQAIAASSPKIRQNALDAAAFSKACADVVQPLPAKWTTKGMYVTPLAGQTYQQAWDTVKASGVQATSMMCGLSAADVTYVGAKTWVLIANGYTQTQVQQWLPPVVNTGLVTVAVVFDEPQSAADLATATQRTAYCHTLGIQTAVTGYSPAMLTAAKDCADILVMDAYPSRTGWDLSVQKQCVAAIEAAGKPYTIVLDCFDGTNYPLPTPAQLQSEITWARSTNAFGVQVYKWGPPDAGGTHTVTYPTTDPAVAGLLDVLRTL